MSTTLELILTSLAFGAVGLFSPTRAAMAVVMLTGATLPWPRALAYLAGSTLVFGIAVGIGLLGVQAGGDAQSTLTIVAGVAMLIVAAGMTVVHRRRQPEPEAEPRHPILSAFGVGVGVSFQSTGRLFVLLAGGYRIAVLAKSVPEALIFGGIMVAIWQTPIWGLMLMSIFAPHRFAAVERRARPALDRIENGVIGIVIVALLGAWLVYVGVRG
ncbi:MAG TPA: hypothetical protein VFW95_01635 [Candidatus Limnocylindria bacterium]|nr:hypothetical protein [Candidatus Limnocylindria bacterium]